MPDSTLGLDVLRSGGWLCGRGTAVSTAPIPDKRLLIHELLLERLQILRVTGAGQLPDRSQIHHDPWSQEATMHSAIRRSAETPDRITRCFHQRVIPASPAVQHFQPEEAAALGRAVSSDEEAL